MKEENFNKAYKFLEDHDFIKNKYHTFLYNSRAQGDAVNLTHLLCDYEAHLETQWLDINFYQPIRWAIYDIIVKWKDTEKPDIRTGVIYVESDAKNNGVPYFQNKGYYDCGLFEMTYFISEGIITHFKRHIPLPEIYNI